ncbi:Acyl-CoA dehydrogenase domain protein [Paraburkholderia piptadeniae]|uniref:Acyl-CoA dehydrogenase domain protein n=1 Tax=Paraburkholderia piptadeniae TaxID=1701573 RepID=A0A1N7SUJ4_9BURK|nr:acyl-CoA dehydrogenase C-terminal domain-containing protein [Paraburkholderia piptadeniae]SIT51036.1 Acyl-CoA dehydrogenase domain protein [Paraburkholderia piptadeniae]
MPTYRAPVKDWLFILHDFLRVEERKQVPGFAELTPDLTSAVLEAAAQFHEEVLHPLNQPGDSQGAQFHDGQVRTPNGFKAAWDAYREAGWHRLSLAEALGGAGLPPVMSVPLSEMRASTGQSFSMYSSFCAPAASMLAALAPEWIKRHVVPRLSDGDWTATMCMTEPQAGTDLRQISTRATCQPDGTWRITGRKIFISGGDHDMADNIVHIVLAKVPDAEGRVPADLSSVHVFMVSKRIIDPHTGDPGELNNVFARSIEHKMGIEGSATCALDFESAVAWRIGETGGRGTAANMAPMFHLMNYARVGTAVSGVGYAEIARQNAADYARERRSGRAGPKLRDPLKVADPIIAHADVRRLLLEARSFAEGARAGAMRAAMWQSIAQSAPDAEERQAAADMLDILTPVMKAFFTDRGFDAAVACQQVLGGHGYIKDYGIEQFVRNARVGQLYEGANGIQATDLVHRKLFSHEGRPWKHFARAISDFIERHSDDVQLKPYTVPLDDGLQRLSKSFAWLNTDGSANYGRVDAASYDVLTAMGILYVGWTWGEIAAIVLDGTRCRYVDETTRATKLALAKAWMQRQMPLLEAMCRRIECGNDSLLSMPDDWI